MDGHGRNPVFALEMIQTLRILGMPGNRHSKSRNPVFALEMIQTLNIMRISRMVIRSQSSIRPGDDSDVLTEGLRRGRKDCRNPVFALEMIQTIRC